MNEFETIPLLEFGDLRRPEIRRSIEHEEEVIVNVLTQRQNELASVLGGDLLVRLTVELLAVLGDRSKDAGPITLPG